MFWAWEKHQRWREAMREEGRIEGRKEGYIEGWKEGWEEGREEVREENRKAMMSHLEKVAQEKGLTLEELLEQEGVK